MLVFNGEILFSHSVPFLEQIWDHFMMWLHHHIITSKTATAVQCDKDLVPYSCIGPPWYLGIIVNIILVEKQLCKSILDKFHIFFYLLKVPNSNFSVRPYSVTCRFFWLSYFWTRKPGMWPDMFFVIVLTKTNHNFKDFAPPLRNQKHIFWCHTVRNGTDLRRSPLVHFQQLISP